MAHVAVKTLNTSYRVIVEIASELPPDDLFAVKKAYQRRYKHYLEEDVASNTTGDLRKILVALVSTHRYDGIEVNATLASSEAGILHKAVESKAFNHEDLIRILSTRSKTQLNVTFNRYRDAHGVSLTKILVPLVGTYRYDGHEVDANLASAKANILHGAIDAKAFDNEDVIRIMTRSKAQLNATFNRYRDAHGVSITKVPKNFKSELNYNFHLQLGGGYNFHLQLGVNE